MLACLLPLKYKLRGRNGLVRFGWFIGCIRRAACDVSFVFVKFSVSESICFCYMIVLGNILHVSNNTNVNWSLFGHAFWKLSCFVWMNICNCSAFLIFLCLKMWYANWGLGGTLPWGKGALSLQCWKTRSLISVLHALLLLSGEGDEKLQWCLVFSDLEVRRKNSQKEEWESAIWGCLFLCCVCSLSRVSVCCLCFFLISPA